MTKRNKSRGYLIWTDQSTGKRGKEKMDDFMEEFMSDAGVDEEPLPEPIRILSCPYKLDNSKIAAKIFEPFKKLKLSCEIDIEISAAVEPQISNKEHIHNVIIDADETKFPPKTDLSEYEFDMASVFCGLFYSVKPKVEVKLAKQELIEDKNTLKLIRKIADDAVKNSKELTELGEDKANEQKLKNIETLFTDFSRYFKEHLTKVVERTIERLEFETYLLNERAEERESSIKIMLEEFEKELRKRLPTAKGRIPIKQRSDFEEMRGKFAEKCQETFRELESKNARLNKSQLAKKIFRGDNPLLLLNRKLKDFDLTFEEILQKYIEQKSS